MDSKRKKSVRTQYEISKSKTKLCFRMEMRKLWEDHIT